MKFRYFFAAVAIGGLAAAAFHIAMQPASPPKPAKAAKVFTFPLSKYLDMPGFPQWSAVVERSWARNDDKDHLCSERVGRPCQLRTWHRFLGELQMEDGELQLAEVNRFVNRVAYRPDNEIWGQTDYWAAPGEFFASGGDCEDFAIAKYYSLKALGFSSEQLRILVLKDTQRKLMHAVLVVDWLGQSFLLDNLSDRVLTWREAQHYEPIYSINETAFNLHKGRRAASSTVAAAGELLPPESTWLRADRPY